MDVIPFIRFVGSIIIGGILLYLFFPIADWITAYFPNIVSTPWFILILAIWAAFPFIIIFRESVNLIMGMQERTGYR